MGSEPSSLKLQQKEMEALDIGYWRAAHEVCPNCGIKFAELHPMANLWPHWINDCPKKSEDKAHAD